MTFRQKHVNIYVTNRGWRYYMFTELFALISNIVALMSSNPLEDILLILSACAVGVVFVAVIIVRAIRRRINNKTK